VDSRKLSRRDLMTRTAALAAGALISNGAEAEGSQAPPSTPAGVTPFQIDILWNRRLVLGGFAHRTAVTLRSLGVQRSERDWTR
jgi:hypothetical protein